jgi:hydroxysqualene synthase
LTKAVAPRDRFEAPSGKHAGSENFPVASRLVRRALRPHAVAFYDFARAIDDVADAPDLAPDDKRRRLLAFDAVLAGTSAEGPETAVRLRSSLEATGVPARHGRDLVKAFLRDVDQHRYADWDDLMSYCALSAAPVGRFLLDLHGEDGALWGASDDLCAALQVINHLQDCGDDYRDLDRVYVPAPWLAAEGLDVDVLAARRSPQGLRRVLDRLLDGTDALLRRSAPMALAVRDRGLALEVAAIQALAERLAGELRHRDPLAERVKLGRVTMVGIGLRAAAAIALRRAFKRQASPARTAA